MAALRTGTAGVSGINQNNRHACPQSLVLDLETQIRERPVRVSCALGTSNRYPVSNPAEFFQRDRASGVPCLLHDLFGNNVIGVFLEVRLFTRHTLEFALGRLRSIALEISTAVCEL